MGLEFFASEVDTDAVSYWSDERCQDVHELYVRFAVGEEDRDCGLCLWREYDAAGGPGRFATEPIVAYTDREPTVGITQVYLTRGQIRVALRKGEEVTAHFDLEEEEFERIRDSLREIFTDKNTYSERLAEPGAGATRGR
jgi:hypothetical protein